MDKFAEIRVPISHKNPSIRRKENKCVLCGKCKDVCAKQVGVAGYWKYKDENIVCVNCGQCANFCPVGAIVEQDNSNDLLSFIQDPNKKVAVIVAPAVRVSLGEMFGLPVGEFVAGKMVSAIKTLGVDYVFDVSFGADLTVMEEANDLVENLTTSGRKPMFSSCCPAWVQFVKSFYPQFVPNLSSCKSPIAMLSSVIKNWFAKNKNINPTNLAVVAITPCVAKKIEANLLCLRGTYGKDTDCVLTVRELGRLLKNKGVDFASLQNSCFDKPFDVSSVDGTKFGASGGVLQAVVNTAYQMMTNIKPPKDLVAFKPVKGVDGVNFAEVKIQDKLLKVCAVSGLKNTRKLLDKLKKFDFDFVEVMACPNGCVGGGGQPKNEDILKADNLRGESLNNFNASQFENCFENENISGLYQQFLIAPGSEKAQGYLHVNHCAR